jgi:hypothetical protein
MQIEDRRDIAPTGAFYQSNGRRLQSAAPASNSPRKRDRKDGPPVAVENLCRIRARKKIYFFIKIVGDYKNGKRDGIINIEESSDKNGRIRKNQTP